MANITIDREPMRPTTMSDIPNRPCPICNTPASTAKLFLNQNIDTARLSAFSFASRKLPEFMCHRLVQCPVCDLVYADAPPDQSTLAQAYHESDFDSDEEANDAAEAYIRVIRPLLRDLPQRQSALEIGTGTGIFLDKLKAEGFAQLVGVEPSVSAISAAPAHRHAWIRQGIFSESDFAPQSFDLVCCFMTLEHVRDPQVIATSARRLLKPGGALVFVTHDYRSVVNRLLGKRSPIIDIEHMQLFSQKSITELLNRSGFNDVRVSSFYNRYSLQYWLRLLPLPALLKRAMTALLQTAGVAQSKVSINVGNMVSHGFIPRQ